MPYVLKHESYDIYIGDILFDKKGRCRWYCSNAPKKDAHKFRTAQSAEKFLKEHCRPDYEVVYIKPVPMNRKEYEKRKRRLKKQFTEALAELENEWNTRGKNNPNFHKI